MIENIWSEKEEENHGKVILPQPREVLSKKGMVNSGRRVKPEELDLSVRGHCLPCGICS